MYWNNAAPWYEIAQEQVKWYKDRHAILQGQVQGQVHAEPQARLAGPTRACLQRLQLGRREQLRGTVVIVGTTGS